MSLEGSSTVVLTKEERASFLKICEAIEQGGLTDAQANIAISIMSNCDLLLPAKFEFYKEERLKEAYKNELHLFRQRNQQLSSVIKACEKEISNAVGASISPGI